METDLSQHDASGQADNLMHEGTLGFPLVGIGASAGGIRMLQQFFAAMPPNSGMAFVVILHLAPEYESNLAGLLQQTTSMEVTQVTAATLVERNRVYIIPPNKQLSMLDGSIQLQELEGARGQRAPIDLFFRTLAETQGRSATAVILSGNGSDGTIGIKRIKECGGLTIVQEPQEAEYDGMPRSAVATGLIDFVLPLAAMPEALVTYWSRADQIELSASEIKRFDSGDDAMREIFALLRNRTGHDFSQYKRPTLLRRIARRMQVNGVSELPDYVETLRARSEEVHALLRDLLISVTNFFRDFEAWRALEAILPQLFGGKEASDQVRVWVAGCATGEEAYSVAMLLYEYAVTLAQPPSIQVFATDIDDEAIATARNGIYTETIDADVSPERLERFFVFEQDHYRIKKEIRDLVLFAPHNLLRDPPFSRLDLITCRNLLIYLNREVQSQVLQLFHFTLRSSGYLLLGSSESTDSVPNLFMPSDKSQRLYQRRITVTSLPSAMPNMPLIGLARRVLTEPRRGSEGSVHSLAELHQQMLAQHTLPSVLLDENYTIMHLSRGAGRFLQFVEGEPSHNLLKVVHPSLRLELRTALYKATQENSIQRRRVPVELDEQPRLIGVLIQPIVQPEWARGYSLVIFEDLGDLNEIEPITSSDAEPLVSQLEEELQRTRDLQLTTVEQYETAVEEYKAANEELQAINEELRAATEELETSKEELQSVNEELLTVNQELKLKIEELSQTNNDLQNLMASTEIGTLFVDRELRIKRYTPSLQALFNLIAGDSNRPLEHITHNLDYPQLVADARRVLEKLAVVTREVQSSTGQSYIARLLPYRTADDRIDGVTLTFVDVSERKQAEQSVLLREEAVIRSQKELHSQIAAYGEQVQAHEQQRLQLEQLVAALPGAVAVLSGGDDYRHLLINAEYARLAAGRGELLGQPLAAIWPERAAVLLPLLASVAQTGTPANEPAVQLPAQPDGPELRYQFSYRPIFSAPGQLDGILLVGSAS